MGHDETDDCRMLVTNGDVKRRSTLGILEGGEKNSDIKA